MLCEFLEVAVHLILYVREVYPVGIFQKRKKYNVPVQVRPHSPAGATPEPQCVDSGFKKNSYTFRPSPLILLLPGIHFQVPAAADSLTISHPSLQWLLPCPVNWEFLSRN